MAKLLYIQSAIGKERCASMVDVGNVFLEAYQETHPNDRLESFNIWETELLEFDEVVLNASFAIMHRLNHRADEAEAWTKVTALVDQFKAADKYLFNVPMWHFGIPYRLKQYLDLLIHPGQTFTYHPGEPMKGLITGKPAAVIYSRFDGYRSGARVENFDFQKRIMEQALGLMGFTHIHSIVAMNPMPGTPHCSDPDNSRAKDQAIRMAASF